MSDALDPDHCIECDHPGSHHDAGECWTDAQGREVSGGSVCGCGWYTPRYASAMDLLGIAPDFTGGLSVDEYMDEQRDRNPE